MFTEKDIKDIPKYITKKINQKDKHDFPFGDSQRRFYSYLTKFKGELAKVTVAVRNRYSKWYCKQVAVHGVHSDSCLVKDMEFYMISGYVVGWYEQGLQNYRKFYESEKWQWAYDKYYDPFAPVINPEFALKFKEYKYSQANKYPYCNILKYLRLYEKYPQAEYLMKLNLYSYATSKTLLQKIGKDKNFRTWLIRNSAEIALKSYYVSTILKAYKENKNLEFVQQFEVFNKSFIHSEKYLPIKKAFNGNIERFFIYLKSQNTNDYSSYYDYLTACEKLGLDMTKDKNLIPHNFKYWHDIRIDEYNSKKAELDKKERAKFYKQFEDIANKYLSMQRNMKDNYVVLIAKSPADLMNEGNKLHHCVGSMGYDQRFINEQSLIFFVRLKNNIEQPLVTIEYSLNTHDIIQCRAEHNATPSDEILNFVNKKWLPYANRKLKQIAL